MSYLALFDSCLASFLFQLMMNLMLCFFYMLVVVFLEADRLAFP